MLEELPCRRNVGNSHDPYAVAMVRASTIVGHVARSPFVLSFFDVEEILLAQSLGADTTQEICLKGALKFEGNDKELTRNESSQLCLQHLPRMG